MNPKTVGKTIFTSTVGLVIADFCAQVTLVSCNRELVSTKSSSSSLSVPLAQTVTMALKSVIKGIKYHIFYGDYYFELEFIKVKSNILKLVLVLVSL